VPKTAAAFVIFTLSPAHIRESIDFRKFYYPHDEINRCTTNQYARLASQQDAEMLVVPILIPRACAKALQGRVMWMPAPGFATGHKWNKKFEDIKFWNRDLLSCDTWMINILIGKANGFHCSDAEVWRRKGDFRHPRSLVSLKPPSMAHLKSIILDSFIYLGATMCICCVAACTTFLPSITPCGYHRGARLSPNCFASPEQELHGVPQIELRRRRRLAVMMMMMQ
jgi:hypothetical protein